MTRYISTKENPNGDIMPEDIGKYTNLHAHSIFSPLDGFGKLDEYCERAKALGFKGLCLSEHGNMMGHLKQRDACKKHGLKPIYANEGYFTLQSGNLKEKVEGYKSAYHILLIAMNEEGYKNLMKMTSIAWIKYKYYKPRFDLELMEECSEGIICTSACLGGAISQLLLSGKEEEAEEVALRLKHIYKDRFYLELTYTGLEEQDAANKFLKQLSIKHNIPLVITTDSHYVYPWQSDAHAKLVMINTGGVINKAVKETSLSDNEKEESDVDNSGMFYQPGQYYVKPWHVLHEEYYNDELDAIAFENSNKIAEMCNVDLKYEDKMIFPKPYENPHEVLTSKVMEWYKDYTKGFPEDKKKEYLDRLELELSVYDKMDFSSYPLVLEDIIDYCKANDIWTGPGRGCSTPDTEVFYRANIPMYANGQFVQYNKVTRTKAISEFKTPLPQIENYPSIFEEVWTHKNRWRKILKVNKYELKDDEMLISINGIATTLDHMHLIAEGGWHHIENYEPVWKKAEDISLFDYLLIPGNKLNIDGTYQLDLRIKERLKGFDEYTCVEVGHIKHVKPSHKYVYDLEVEEDGSFLIYGSGDSVCFTHNSAAGSLISYALGLTQIDPIPYGLMFSRYLSAGRAKYPLIEFDGYPLNEWK